jgi:hypothetical protein
VQYYAFVFTFLHVTINIYSAFFTRILSLFDYKQNCICFYEILILAEALQTGISDYVRLWWIFSQTEKKSDGGRRQKRLLKNIDASPGKDVVDSCGT